MLITVFASDAKSPKHRESTTVLIHIPFGPRLRWMPRKSIFEVRLFPPVGPCTDFRNRFPARRSFWAKVLLCGSSLRFPQQTAPDHLTPLDLDIFGDRLSSDLLIVICLATLLCRTVLIIAVGQLIRSPIHTIKIRRRYAFHYCLLSINPSLF
jgi:hypothetical protein